MIASIEQELSARYGAKLEPIIAPLSDRGKYASLAKLTNEEYKVKGGGQVADRLIREKTGNR